MSMRVQVHRLCLLAVLSAAGTLCGQAPDLADATRGSLQQHLDKAQDLQRTGNLNGAADEYRAFVAGAVSQLAGEYAVARDYAQSTVLFDEALALQPERISLLLDEARVALMQGDLERARMLATQCLERHPVDPQLLAQAHQLLGRTLLKLSRMQDARKELEKAVALDPTFANGYDLAVACLDMADEKCAVQIFSEMEKSFGDTAELHMAFGRAYGESDFQPRAITEFRRAIQENPHLPQAHYLLAALLLATGDEPSHVEEARAELRRELENSPSDAATYAALGQVASTHHEDAEAETYLKKAIALGTTNPDAYLYLGQMYAASNRSSEAEIALRRSVELTTDVSRNRYQVQKAHFLLGRILMQKGQQDQAHAEMALARELANKTLSQDKKNLTALTDTATTEAPGSAAEVQSVAPASHAAADPQVLRKVEEVRREIGLPIADSYNNLGAIAATGSDYKAAVKYFAQAFRWNPSLDGLDYNWGRAAFAGAQFREAIGPLSRYVKAHPDDVGGLSVLAISQFMEGSYSDCLLTLERAPDKAALAPQAEYVYAASLVKTGLVAAGMERLQVLEESHPEIADVHRTLGEAWAQQGNAQRSVDELRKALTLSPADAEAHYDLGREELASGNKVFAVEELEAATRLQPTSERFHQQLAEAYTAALRPADAKKEIETSKQLHEQMK